MFFFVVVVVYSRVDGQGTMGEVPGRAPVISSQRRTIIISFWRVDKTILLRGYGTRSAVGLSVSHLIVGRLSIQLAPDCRRPGPGIFKTRRGDVVSTGNAEEGTVLFAA